MLHCCEPSARSPLGAYGPASACGVGSDEVKNCIEIVEGSGCGAEGEAGLGARTRVLQVRMDA